MEAPVNAITHLPHYPITPLPIYPITHLPHYPLTQSPTCHFPLAFAGIQ